MEVNQGETIQEPHADTNKGGRKPVTRWLNPDEVRERYGNISIATLNRWIRNETFPQGVTFGGSMRLWDERELDALDAQRRTVRDAAKEVRREKRRASEEKASKKARGEA